MIALVAPIALSLGTANNSGSNDFGTFLDPLALAYVVSNSGSTGAANLTAFLTLGTGFKIISKSCPPTLPAGGKCWVLVEATPSAIGQTDTLNIASTSGLGTTAVMTVPAKGTQNFMTLVGVPEFGIVYTGEAAAISLRVVNTSGSSRTVSAVGTMLNTSFTKVGDGCTNQTLAAGAACDVDIKFAPTATGALDDVVYVNFSNAGPRGFAFVVRGEGVGPVLSLTGSGAFGPVSLGSSSRQSYTITNTGTGEARNVTARTAPGSEFLITDTSCDNAWLPAGRNCKFDITFTPTTLGALAGSVIFTSTNATLADLALSGTSIGPTLVVTGTADFGTVTAPAYVTRVFTVTNSGSGAAFQVKPSLSVGTNEFAIGATDCVSSTLPSGASCLVEVQFSPSVTGSYTNDLVIDALGQAPNATTLTGVAL